MRLSQACRERYHWNCKRKRKSAEGLNFWMASTEKHWVWGARSVLFCPWYLNWNDKLHTCRLDSSVSERWIGIYEFLFKFCLHQQCPLPFCLPCLCSNFCVFLAYGLFCLLEYIVFSERWICYTDAPKCLYTSNVIDTSANKDCNKEEQTLREDCQMAKITSES